MYQEQFTVVFYVKVRFYKVTKPVACLINKYLGAAVALAKLLSDLWVQTNKPQSENVTS